MVVTMVKKRLASGEPCRKCAQTEDMLRRRGLWERIDEVVWAEEDDPDSPGMQLAARLGVERAPFFVVTDGSAEVVYESALKLIKERLSAERAAASADVTVPDDAPAADAEPLDIVRWGLERFGAACAIAFSGADDVVLVDLAARTGLPFSVLTVDTGRLHPETYEFLETVRSRYGVALHVAAAEPEPVQALVREKGLFSFYEDGHQECCGVRKVEPLRRALAGYRAWMTGQRRDQSADTRADLGIVERDPTFAGAGGGALTKLNPLAAWSSAQVWAYIHERGVPYNPLHERGFVSIGCAPCTRAIAPGQHERAGRWWWEEADKKECGLHAGNLRRRVG